MISDRWPPRSPSKQQATPCIRGGVLSRGCELLAQNHCLHRGKPGKPGGGLDSGRPPSVAAHQRVQRDELPRPDPMSCTMKHRQAFCRCGRSKSPNLSPLARLFFRSCVRSRLPLDDRPPIHESVVSRLSAFSVVLDGEGHVGKSRRPGHGEDATMRSSAPAWCFETRAGPLCLRRHSGSAALQTYHHRHPHAKRGAPAPAQ